MWIFHWFVSSSHLSLHLIDLLSFLHSNISLSVGAAGTCFHSDWARHDHTNAEAFLLRASRQFTSTQHNPSQQTQPLLSGQQQPPRLISWQSDASKQRLQAVCRNVPTKGSPFMRNRPGLPSIIHLRLLIGQPDFRCTLITSSWSDVS